MMPKLCPFRKLYILTLLCIIYNICNIIYYIYFSQNVTQYVQILPKIIFLFKNDLFIGFKTHFKKNVCNSFVLKQVFSTLALLAFGTRYSLSL